MDGGANVAASESVDLLIPAAELKVVGAAAYSARDRLVAISQTGDGIQWTGTLPRSGVYQVWVTYYCEDRNAQAELLLQGQKKSLSPLYMGADTIQTFYGSNDRPLTKSAKKGAVPEPYFFREYWGAFQLGTAVNLRLVYSGCSHIRVQSIEFNREGRHGKDLEPLLRGAIGFYENATQLNGLTRNIYNIQKQDESTSASTAVCGVALTAFALHYALDGKPESRDRALNLLRVLNGKVPSVRLGRHSSGLYQHFINSRTGESTSEYSTIDTAILVSGVLMARNAFPDPEIKKEADEIWNSITWSRFVIKPGPLEPKFYFTGDDIDSYSKETNPEKIRGIGMFNEYILLAYFCQKYEDTKGAPASRRRILPDLQSLPMQVFRNRILLSAHIQPSFIVQFPFFMSPLANSDRYFSFTAAQGLADRSYNTEFFKDRCAWGVSAGCTPEKGYEVCGFLNNSSRVVAPPIMAGFIPTLPLAADDLFDLYKKPSARLKLEFGEILPRYVPGSDWKLPKIEAVDFSPWLYGLAWNHPRIGRAWFVEMNKFTFNQK